MTEHLMTCACRGTRWVCENHPQRPWGTAPGECDCGAGAPCSCSVLARLQPLPEAGDARRPGRPPGLVPWPADPSD